VLPSTYESFGFVAAEAMARGRPVVAATAGGLREVVEDERTGLLFAVGDVGGFCEATLRLLRNADLRRELGSGGHRAYLEKYRASRVAADYLELYKRTLGARDERAPVLIRQHCGSLEHSPDVLQRKDELFETQYLTLPRERNGETISTQYFDISGTTEILVSVYAGLAEDPQAESLLLECRVQNQSGDSVWAKEYYSSDFCGLRWQILTAVVSIPATKRYRISLRSLGVQDILIRAIEIRSKS
jgi:hypothetical protein